MWLSVQELELRKVRFQVAFEPGRIIFEDARVKQAAPLEVAGVAELFSPDAEIRVHGHIRGALEADCDRCLEEVAFAINADFDLSYVPDTYDGRSGEEQEVAPAVLDIGYYEGSGIELADVVHEQVLLWLPMQRLCRPDCKGICPVCGQNRNQQDCGCHTASVDDRWAALRQFQEMN